MPSSYSTEVDMVTLSGVPSHKYIVVEGDDPVYVLVDAFGYASLAPKESSFFFLSHAHSDHYTGLKSSWKFGKIYCSEITGKLVHKIVGVDEKWLCPLNFGQRCLVPDSQIFVTIIDAFHCPGAVIFLFELPDGKKIVHTGDFRYNAETMENCEQLLGFKGCNSLYLDTTYCNTRHVFPKQDESISYIVKTVSSELNTEITATRPWPCIILISTYVIGKEKILEQVARAAGGFKLYVDERKQGILSCLDIDMDIFTRDSESTPIHVVKWNFLGETWPYFRPNFVDAKKYAEQYGAKRVVAFVPTGWVSPKTPEDTFKVVSKGNVCIHLVPYSEHSSYQELLDFVSLLKPQQVVPTVNASDEKSVDKQLKHFKNLIDINASRVNFISKFWKENKGNARKNASLLVPEIDLSLSNEYSPAGKSNPQKEPVNTTKKMEIKDNTADVLALKEVCCGLTTAEAEKLLWRMSGDVQSAIGLYFDSKGDMLHGKQTTPCKRKTPGTKLEGSRKSQMNITHFFKSPSKSVSDERNIDEKVQKTKPNTSNIAATMKTAAPPKENTVKINPSVPVDAVGCAIEKYHPVEHAPWFAGDAAPYLHISRTFETIENTTKRLRISDMLVNAFRSILILSKDDILKAAYLFLGRLAPDYVGIELNIGGSTVSSAITDALGISRNGIRELYTSLGDLGDVAAHCKRKQATLIEPAPLSVSRVYDSFYSIASESGAGSSNRKKQILTKLLRSSKESEIKYLVRTAVANLRIRAGWKSIIPALAKAIAIHKKQAKGDGTIDISSFPDKESLNQAANTSLDAFYLCPNLEQLIDTMNNFDIEDWSTHCSLTPGIPIKPMLAKISKGFEDVYEQIRNEKDVLLEWKYDGMRAQIHANKNGLNSNSSLSNTIKIFSRNMEDRTSSFPDMIDPILQSMGDSTSSCILDGEIVAIKWNDCKSTYTIRAFQDLSTRPRVAGNEKIPSGGLDGKSEVSVCFFAFDILEMNGQNVANLPLRTRRNMLREALKNLIPGQVEMATGSIRAISCDRADESANRDTNKEQLGLNSIKNLLLESLNKGAEGLMIKSLDSSYEPNKRSNYWIKLKKDYCDGLHDTIDVVPIGAWHGNGRKAGWYSPFLLAIWDSNTEEYQSLCRCISGFSDQFYKDATERLSQTIIPKKPLHYKTNENPSIWFDAKEVWEIRGAEISISPVHGAATGQVHEERGLGLRFPRFIRIRDDKTPEEATDATQIVDMFTSQGRKTHAAR